MEKIQIKLKKYNHNYTNELDFYLKFALAILILASIIGVIEKYC